MTDQTHALSRGQRILRFPLTRIVVATIGLIAAIGFAQFLLKQLPARETQVMRLLVAGILAIVSLGVYTVFVRWVERRPVSELSASGAWGEWARGLGLGAALMTAVIAVLWALGLYKVSGINPWTAILPVLTISITSGVIEEVVFRGVFFRIIEESLGTWITMGVTALFFGLLHLVNPNATLVAGLAIALEAGILLAAIYVLTRRLWMVIGIHMAWNFTQGGLFGVAVSGNQRPGLLQSTLQGPHILTGGEFGAEASLVTVILCFSAGLYFIWRGRQKGHFVRPFWRR